jgi:hypothetical protein
MLRASAPSLPPALDCGAPGAGGASRAGVGGASGAGLGGGAATGSTDAGAVAGSGLAVRAAACVAPSVAGAGRAIATVGAAGAAVLLAQGISRVHILDGVSGAAFGVEATEPLAGGEGMQLFTAHAAGALGAWLVRVREAGRPCVLGGGGPRSVCITPT